MKRALAAFACVVLWSACVLALAGWVRSHRAGDHLAWRGLFPDGPALRDREVCLQSSRGGVRLAVRWGTLPNLGEPANTREYGAPGLTRRSTSPGGYPSAETPSVA